MPPHSKDGHLLFADTNSFVELVPRSVPDQIKPLALPVNARLGRKCFLYKHSSLLQLFHIRTGKYLGRLRIMTHMERSKGKDNQVELFLHH